MQTSLRNVVGLPVSGRNYFGYVPEYRKIWSMIDSGSDVMMYGPRRSGKTSLLYRIMEGSPEKEFNVIYIDASSINEPHDFVSALFKGAKTLPSAESALTTASRRLKEGLQGISKAEVSLTGLKLEFNKDISKEWNWKVAGEILLSSLNSLDKPVLIILDEFSYFLSSLTDQQIQSFLQWFRSVRQHHETSQQIRWLVTSEIHLDYILKNISSPYVFQDFSHLTIPPLDNKTADELLYALITSLSLDVGRSIREYILSIIGDTYPFYIQAFVAALNDHMEDQDVSISTDIIDKVFDRLISDRSRMLFPMASHLLYSQVGKDSSKLAENLLIYLSKSKDGRKLEEVNNWLSDSNNGADTTIDELRMIIDILSQEFVLSVEDDVINISSNILRQYYLKNKQQQC